jgi:hypothetical protein
MSTATIIGLILIGIAAGSLSGMVGIGGGIVVVPSLVFFLAVSQKTAQGTSLAMLMPPIGIFAVINYYKAGYVDVKMASILAAAFIVGSIAGSKFSVGLSEHVIKKVFGGFLLLISMKYLFFSK